MSTISASLRLSALWRRRRRDRVVRGRPASKARERPFSATGADGRVGTRNYIGILPSVNCSATVARLAATIAERRGLASMQACDGVIALTHDLGCGMARGTT